MSLVQTFGLRGPLILAPLGGGPSTPELVAAVCNAGGLGSLGCAYNSPQEITSILRRTRELTSRPFAVNLFAPAANPLLSSDAVERAIDATREYRHELDLATPEIKPPYGQDFDAQFEAMLDARPAAFSFTFGLLHEKYLAACRTRAIFTMGTATDLHEALALERSGVDCVVAQGAEAGGHRGLFSANGDDPQIGVLSLVSILTRHLRVPVVAAGGMGDGRAIAAVLALGAQAAQLGTAFLACPEAGTSSVYRKALLAAGNTPTRLTRAFSGRWARGLPNRFMIEMEERADATLPFPAQNAFTRDIRRRAAERGRAEFLSLWAGQSVATLRAMPAAELVEKLLFETSAALREATTRASGAATPS